MSNQIKPSFVWKIKLIYQSTFVGRYCHGDGRYLGSFRDHNRWTFKFYMPTRGRDPGGHRFRDLSDAKSRLNLKIIRQLRDSGQKVVIVRVNVETQAEDVVWPEEDIPVLDRITYATRDL